MKTKMKGMRISGRALEIMEIMQREKVRKDSDFLKFALVAYAEKEFPQLSEELKKELFSILQDGSSMDT